MFSLGHSLKERPKEVQGQGVFEHWELGTVVSGRGKEFTCYATLEQELGLRLYFTAPCSACQRESNENANGL